MRHVIISRDSHYGKRIRQLPSFAYAAGTAAVEVVVGEIAQMTASFPMFFVPAGDYVKVIALLGLTQGENLFVDQTGNWTGPYIPATLRCYPFALGETKEDGQLTVMIDADCDLLSDTEGAPLFGSDDGEPSGPLADAVRILTQMNIEGSRTLALASQLNQFGLLKPSQIAISRNGAKQDLDGMLVIDEAALNKLPDEQFLALRRSGALTVAYAQMFSLAQMARLQAKARERDGSASAHLS